MYGEMRGSEKVRAKKCGSCVVVWAQLITIMCSLCVYVPEVDEATNGNVSCVIVMVLE